MNMEKIIITGAGSELQGVGRLPDGRAVFVPGALPGEEVRIEITKDAGRYCEARLREILKASADRVTPDCGAFGHCGGCAARHMRYAASLELKRQKVVDALSRIGGVENPTVRPAIGCDDPNRTRNKAEYAVSCFNGQVKIGPYAAKSRSVISVSDCLAQKEPSVRAMRWLGEHLREFSCAAHIRDLVTRVNRAGEMLAVFSADAPVQTEVRELSAALRRAVPETESVYFCRLRNRPTHALDGACQWIEGKRTMEDHLLGLRFELSPQSFFQVNPEQTERLYTAALEAAALTPASRVLDAYCGAGTITLAAARTAAFALGVEIVGPAVENAKRNAQANGLAGKARFVCADAALEIPRQIARGERFDAAILDPPRKGADAALLDALVRANIPRIAYVSCNPATLARDVKLLCAQGYRLEWAQPVDMFPYTEHVEAVCLLIRS